MYRVINIYFLNPFGILNCVQTNCFKFILTSHDFLLKNIALNRKSSARKIIRMYKCTIFSGFRDQKVSLKIRLRTGLWKLYLKKKNVFTDTDRFKYLGWPQNHTIASIILCVCVCVCVKYIFRYKRSVLL